jgi:hypothetical protein
LLIEESDKVQHSLVVWMESVLAHKEERMKDLASQVQNSLALVLLKYFFKENNWNVVGGSRRSTQFI